MRLPLTSTLSGLLARAWLRNSAMTLLPPSWPQSLAVSTTAEACAVAAVPDRLDLEREVAEVALKPETSNV